MSPAAKKAAHKRVAQKKAAKKKAATKKAATKKKPVARRGATKVAAPVAPIRMAPEDYERARRALLRLDPRIGELIKRVGPCTLRVRTDGDLFSALCETITSQQLSTRVADVIYSRVCALCAPEPHPTPAAILRLDTAALRGAGLSGPKAAYVHALAERVSHGDLSLETLDVLPDDEVIAVLSSIKGIGRWSAQMILIFRLHRPDVWPIGDLGIVRGLERLHGLKQTPKPARLEKLGEVWRPYRSVAAWYLWAGGAL